MGTARLGGPFYFWQGPAVAAWYAVRSLRELQPWVVAPAALRIGGR
ncbi:hypothetical protein ACFXS9_17470 [Bradyrhizobium sp. RDI18]